MLVAGSLLDFLITYLLTDLLNCWYVIGNVAGNLTGCVVQYALSRNWVFAKNKQPVPAQAKKFIIMWAGNIALSALFVYLVTHYLKQHYLLSKLIVSVVLGMTYTYIISKKFVFTSPVH